jgi:hypothetical protein
VASIHGSWISAIFTTSGMSIRIVNLDFLSVGEVHLVDHRWRGRDQVEIEFAMQPLLD